MQEIVRAKNLTVSLGGKTVLEDITFSIFSGEMTGVIGPNGAGKTTLLRAVLGLVSVQQGSLAVFGKRGIRIKEIRPRTGYMPQRHYFDRRFLLSAADVVSTGLLSPRTLFKKIPRKNEQVKDALRLAGMENFFHQPFQNLSGGEQQRVLLARALARRPDLLLLDEPNNGLDFPAQQSFVALLRKLKDKENIAIIMVSHDLVSIAPAVDKLLCINRTMHVHGDPAEVLRSPHLDEAYRCQFDFLTTGGSTERWWH